MRTQSPSIALLTLATTCALATSQNYSVAPAAYANSDAPRFCALPGAMDPFRHQILVGPSHLSAVAGKTITAIEFRRSAGSETFSGGAIQLSVRLSASPNAPLDCSATFTDNEGSQPGVAFAGQVPVPTSPAQVGPAIAWSTSNTVRIDLSAPYLYGGGTLCVDILGDPVPGQELSWWMADACFESVSGTANDLGGGCGAFGGPLAQWSSVDERSLVPSGYANFRAYGTPYGLGIAAFGVKSPVGTPLFALGFNAPTGCNLFLATLDVLIPTVFQPDAAVASRGGRADISFKLAPDPLLLGASMTTQWLDWSQSATSNAIEWTIAPAIPALDMALVEGHPLEATGHVSTYMAHVLRFEYQ